jgi:hypothetical protein
MSPIALIRRHYGVISADTIVCLLVNPRFLRSLRSLLSHLATLLAFNLAPSLLSLLGAAVVLASSPRPTRLRGIPLLCGVTFFLDDL